MLNTTPIQVNNSIENKLRMFNSYVDCLQKLSFIQVNFISRTFAHLQGFMNANLGMDNHVLVASYNLIENLANEARQSADDGRQALSQLSLAQIYLEQMRNSKTKESLAEVDSLYANTRNYWKDNLATFNSSRV